MNILPKKRWHVRTKENIARVKEDEAKHEEEQRQIKYRALLADQEARTEVLRKKTKRSNDDAIVSNSSTTALLSSTSGNKEYEAEKRTEQESKEKAIGLLTYLGQSVMETGGQKPWYDMHPKQLQAAEKKSKDKSKEEWEAKKKARADPLNEMNKISEWFENRREQKAREEAKALQKANSCMSAMSSLFPNDIAVPKSSKLKALPSSRNNLKEETSGDQPESISKELATSNSKSNAIEMAKQLRLDALRAERLQRERRERERAALVMAKAMGLNEALPDPVDTEPVDERQLPFNSAFNPELAATLAEKRQRHRDSRKRYAHRD